MITEDGLARTALPFRAARSLRDQGLARPGSPAAEQGKCAATANVAKVSLGPRQSGEYRLVICAEPGGAWPRAALVRAWSHAS